MPCEGTGFNLDDLDNAIGEDGANADGDALMGGIATPTGPSGNGLQHFEEETHRPGTPG